MIGAHDIRRTQGSLRTSSGKEKRTKPCGSSARLGCLFFLVLVLSVSASCEPICAVEAGEDQRKATKMDDQRNSLVTTLRPGKRATEQPSPEEDVFEIMGAYGRIRGVIDWKGKTRVYVKPAAADTIYVFDSEDLRAWKKREKPEFPTKMALIQVDDEIYGYTEEGSSAYLWNEFNPDKGCQNSLGKMYEWKLDGTLAPTHTEAGWIQLGRVRGYGSKNEGGWGDDRAEYPDIQNFPQVKKAFQGTPYDAEQWLQDRRGVSLHTSDNGKHWESRILLAPEDVDLRGFRGWNDPHANGIADFYSAVMIDSQRAFVKVYWKSKDRLIDRAVYNPDIDVRRRFRFTGETTFVPAVLEDGKLRITSTQSVIPKKLHTRTVTKEQVSWATNPGVPEVGQLTPHNRVIIRDGYAYIFYYYRDDIHYEGGWESQHESVNVYMMNEDHFDRLFE